MLVHRLQLRGNGRETVRDFLVLMLERVDLPGIDVWKLRDGLIWRYQAVYDYSLVARQMGLGLPRGGRLEQLAVRAQRLFVRVERGRARSLGRRSNRGG